MGVDPGYEKKSAPEKGPVLPPPYTDAIAEGSQTHSTRYSSIQSDEMHGHDFAGRPGGDPQNVPSQNLGGRRDDSRYENTDRRWSKKGFQRSRGAIGRLVILLMAMLTGFYFTNMAVRNIFGDKVGEFLALLT